jgi:hypothetical protein
MHRATRLRQPRALALIAAAVAPAVAAMAQQAPTLPTIGTVYDNITVANSNVDGGAVVGSNAATNTTVINDALAYVSSQGGGTVEIPASATPYVSDELFLQSNVDLQIDAGATLQNANPSGTFITNTGTQHDIEINGGGVIDGNATAASSNQMMPLEKITNLEVTNVSIENASNEHLDPLADTNVTINNVTISDPLVAASGYLPDAAALDFSGSNFLIENCNISSGDDDICAKPQSVACSNIVIENCTITAGDGIGIGGETQAGLNGMLVKNIVMNNTAYGLRLKAGDGSTASLQNGGLVENVTYINVSMNGVTNPININSFFNGDAENYPASAPYSASSYDSTTPIWRNIIYDDISSIGGGYDARIYALNISPPNLQGLDFYNVSLNGTQTFLMDYAQGVNLENANITNTGGHPQFTEYADTFVTNMQWAGSSLNSAASDTSGTWDNSTTNWIAPGAVKTAWVEFADPQFGAGGGGNSPVIVTLAGPHTVDTITFAANSPAYTLTGSSISLEGDGLGNGITDDNFSVTIASNIVLPQAGNSVAIDVASGGTLNLTGTWTSNNATDTLTKSSPGVLNMHNLSIAGLNITGGTLALIAGGGTAGTSLISGGTFSISGGGALNINDHGMVIEYGSNPSPVGDLSFVANSGPRNYPANSIQAYAQSGFDNFNWNGPGIMSSVAENDPNGLTAVGIADENDLLNVYPSNYSVAGGGSGTWMGQPINDTNNVLVRMTYYGDGNLDGVVNRLDVTALSQGYSGLAGYVGWSDGDYTYSGDITKVDVSLLAQSYLFQGAPLGDAITSGQAQYLLAMDPDMPANVMAGFESIAGTPEPAAIGLLGAAGLGLVVRRRRK